MRHKKSVKAIFFDFGGTLMDAESDKIAHQNMMKDIKTHYSISVSEEDLLEIYQSQLFNNDMTIKEFAQSSSMQFKRLISFSFNAFRGILKEFNIEAKKTDMDWFNIIFLDNHIKYAQLVEGVWDVINQVKDKGCHCGIISDIDNDYQQKQFQSLKLNGVFDSITTSEEVKVYKPGPCIFETALNKASCKGNESIMIGDSYSKDIAGGKNLDMTTIWIDNYQNNLQKPALADYTIKQLKDIIPIFNKILQIS